MSSKAITYRPVFNRKNKELSKDAEALIQIEAYKDAARVYFSTGIYVKPGNWDGAKCVVVKQPDAVQLNNKIIQTIERYKDIELTRNRNNPEFSVWDLKQAIENNAAAECFIAYALGQLAKQKNLAPATVVVYTRHINDLKQHVGNMLPFYKLDSKLLDDFHYSLQAEGLKAGTIKRTFKTLGKYARLAVRHGLLEHNKNPFPAKKITDEKPIKSFLKDAELKKLEGLKFAVDQQHLEVIRDLFLLQCYTGLRFSDVARLSSKYIVTTTEGMLLEMVSQKENKAISLPLRYLFPDKRKESRPERLLRKYWRKDQKPFFLSLKPQSDSANNQYVNRQLKDIQEMAGLQTVLTSHVGRHTFATYLVWRLPLPIVQELLQHSKIDTTMQYIHVGPEKVKEQLAKITDWI